MNPAHGLIEVALFALALAAGTLVALLSGGCNAPAMPDTKTTPHDLEPACYENLIDVPTSCGDPAPICAYNEDKQPIGLSPQISYLCFCENSAYSCSHRVPGT